jgi:hypothetical protein
MDNKNMDRISSVFFEHACKMLEPYPIELKKFIKLWKEDYNAAFVHYTQTILKYRDSSLLDDEITSNFFGIIH